MYPVTARLLFATLVLVSTAAACKKSEPKAGAPAGSATEPAAPASKPVAPPPAAAAAPAAAAPRVELAKFLTDLKTVGELQTVYPAGKRFTVSGTLASAPDCTTECVLELSDGAKNEEWFKVDIKNKSKLDGKAEGAAITLECAPVYDAIGALELEKSCNVQ
ncbi:MAG TPA: hypothetical protein VK427_26520 [Kofleriaceae bacterium]|nr:hypothetical protein [Kofleriaceae bacterium]